MRISRLIPSSGWTGRSAIRRTTTRLCVTSAFLWQTSTRVRQPATCFRPASLLAARPFEVLEETPVDPLSFTARIRLRRKAVDSALSTARLIVPDRLRERFDEMAGLRYWFGVSMLVGSHARIPLLEALWPVLKAHERPDVFASWFDGRDVPEQCYEFLLQALGEFKRSGQRIFDGQKARERFAGLPNVVTIYRGGIEREAIDERLGVSWTLNRDNAIWIATQSRFQNSGYQPVLMTARVSRGAIAGFLVERAEDEVLIVPEDIWLDQVEMLAWINEAPAAALPAVTAAPGT